METLTDDTRVEQMFTQLHSYLALGATDEDGNQPRGLDNLEDFLFALKENVLDTESLRCPFIMPSDDRCISLRWSEQGYDNYVDVDLETYDAEYTVIGLDGLRDECAYNLNDSKDWKSLSEKAAQWTRKTS